MLVVKMSPSAVLVACCLIILNSCGSGSQAAQSIGFFKNPAYPGKCSINANLILNEGAVVQDPSQQCGRIICGKDGFTTFHTCGTQGVPANCHLGEPINPDKNYPECCPRQMICN